MHDYQIKIPTKEEILRKKLDPIRHPKLVALRGVQIGPGWSLPDPDRTMGMRGVVSRKTKNANWMKYRIKRAKRKNMADASRRRNAI